MKISNLLIAFFFASSFISSRSDAIENSGLSEKIKKKAIEILKEFSGEIIDSMIIKRIEDEKAKSYEKGYTDGLSKGQERLPQMEAPAPKPSRQEIIKSVSVEKFPQKGGSGGNEFDDMAKIIESFHDQVAKIRVKEIWINANKWVDCIHFIYEIETKDGNKRLFQGGHHGRLWRGHENKITLADDEFITQIGIDMGKGGDNWRKNWWLVKKLEIATSRHKHAYGDLNRKHMDYLIVPHDAKGIVIHGRSSAALDAIGFYAIRENEEVRLVHDEL